MKRFLSLYFILFIFVCFNCKKDESTVIIKGLVNFISGDVQITGTDGNSRKATVGDEISQGMKIETKGKNSFTDIYIGNYVIKVLGNTVLDVENLFESIKTGNKEVKFNVEKGSLFSRINTKLVKGESYEVKTLTATAAVRGTEFLVSQDDGKSNIVCLKGKVSVQNNSLSGSKSVILEPKEETDVISGEPMVKKQISSDRLKSLNILLQIKNMRDDIRKKFEEQRKEINKYVEDQRIKDKEIFDAQIEKNKKIAEDVKKTGRENIDSIKNKTGAAASQAEDSAKKLIETLKSDKKATKK